MHEIFIFYGANKIYKVTIYVDEKKMSRVALDDILIGKYDCYKEHQRNVFCWIRMDGQCTYVHTTQKKVIKK